MKSGYVYTIIFMLIVSAVFTLVLAGANELFLPQIEQNELLDERLAILYVFDIDQSGSADEVLDRFDKYVAEKEMAEKRQFNENHCKSKGLIYVDKIGAKGECVTREELVKITIENSEKLKEIQKSRANDGLR